MGAVEWGGRIAKDTPYMRTVETLGGLVRTLPAAALPLCGKCLYQQDSVCGKYVNSTGMLCVNWEEHSIGLDDISY